MRNLLSIILLLSISQFAFALQVKRVNDNETITAKISSIDVTRIAIDGDRIKSLRGVKGAYSHENDEENGEVYIQPMNSYQMKAFTILIETELGHHFTLLLNPMAVPADTLLLIPNGVSQNSTAPFEKAPTYELSLLKIIRAMKSNISVDGFKFQPVQKPKLYALKNQVTLKLKYILTGEKMGGEIFELTNSSGYEINLDERQFYKSGTRAISLDNLVVPAHGKIHIYRVVSHVR